MDFVDALLLFGQHALEAGKVAKNMPATFCILPEKYLNKIII